MNRTIQAEFIGWDIGGAHVKAVAIDEAGIVTHVVQQSCPLWQGMQELHAAVRQVLEQIVSTPGVHVMTMTGELVDLFTSRWEGVRQIIEAMESQLDPCTLLIYAGERGFLKVPDITEENCHWVASANWLASLKLVTDNMASGLFVDIGSTTTDILVFNDKKVHAIGMNDFQRLCSDELVYTGIVRTPVMAITDRVDFKGMQVSLMAEHFATMADIYRLTGELTEAHDQMPTADGADKSVAGSARRLARMIGYDYKSEDLPLWRQLAESLREKQLLRILSACEQQLARNLLTDDSVMVGAGTGRFLVRDLAARLGLNYVDFSDIFHYQAEYSDLDVADCAPAAAVACMASRLC